MTCSSVHFEYLFYFELVAVDVTAAAAANGVQMLVRTETRGKSKKSSNDFHLEYYLDC